MSEYVKNYLTIRYAESELGEDGVFRGCNSGRTIPISFTLYLFETGAHRVLVDAGCDELQGFDMKHMIGPVGGLAQYGLKPEDVTDIIITHAHDDHIAGVKHFPHARVYIQEDEYIYGKQFIPESCEVITFQEECVVADCLTVKRIAGHSIGSCIVEFSFEGDKYIITGDEVYSSECFIRHIPTGVSVCPENSQKFLDTYGSGEYKILTCHDFENRVVILPKKEDNTK